MDTGEAVMEVADESKDVVCVRRRKKSRDAELA
jgi:hypothetical protein